MKTIVDPDDVLAEGLVRLRETYAVPAAFPAEVIAAAEQAARRAPGEHADRTTRPFVTLDPPTSTDLDQAFAIETRGNDLLLHYAIADVAWFVADGGPIDIEAWKRGETIYLPDGKAGLYPPVLAEGAASLLPDGPRPAVIFTVAVAPDGAVKLEGAERALIRSRAKLAYDSVRDSDLPEGFNELSRRIQDAELRRGGARVDPPEQEVEQTGERRFRLSFRPRLPSEERNAALSLATNMAIADALQAAGTGLFRVMEGPSPAAIARLRLTAQAFGLDWPETMDLKDYERGLDGHDPKQAAFMLAVRRAGAGASYVPWRAGVVPWHAAMSATYAHGTAPLRRLADRYVVRAALTVANGEAVPEVVTAAFEKLPELMARADAIAGRIERAVIDLAESAILAGHEGESFCAIVTDIADQNARIQLCDLPVVSRVSARGASPGDRLQVRLTSNDIEQGKQQFEVVG